MRNLIKLVVFVLFGAIVLAAQNPPAAKAPDPGPTMKVEDKAAIMEVQLKLANIQNEATQLQSIPCGTPPNTSTVGQINTRMGTLQQDFNKAQAELAKAESAAVEHAGAKGYRVELNGYKLVKEEHPNGNDKR